MSMVCISNIFNINITNNSQITNNKCPNSQNRPNRMTSKYKHHRLMNYVIKQRKSTYALITLSQHAINRLNASIKKKREEMKAFSLNMTKLIEKNIIYKN